VYFISRQIYRSAGCFLLRADGFSKLGRPLRRLRDKKMAIFDIKKIIFSAVLAVFFSSFLVIKPWILIRIHLKCCIRVHNTAFIGTS
jgi:hypothetical protein